MKVILADVQRDRHTRVWQLKRLQHSFAHQTPAIAPARKIWQLHPGKRKIVTPASPPVMDQQRQLMFVEMRAGLIVRVGFSLIPHGSSNRVGNQRGDLAIKQSTYAWGPSSGLGICVRGGAGEFA